MSSVSSTCSDTLSLLTLPLTTETLCFGPSNYSSLPNLSGQPCLVTGVSALALNTQCCLPERASSKRNNPIPQGLCQKRSTSCRWTRVEVHIPFGLWELHPQPHLSHTGMFPFLSTHQTWCNNSAPAHLSFSTFCPRNKALHITCRGTEQLHLSKPTHLPNTYLNDTAGGVNRGCAWSVLWSLQPCSSVDLISAAFKYPCQRISFCCSFL